MEIIKIDEIQDLLVTIDKEKVLLDRDVATLYGIELKGLMKQLKTIKIDFQMDT